MECEEILGLKGSQEFCGLLKQAEGIQPACDPGRDALALPIYPVNMEGGCLFPSRACQPVVGWRLSPAAFPRETYPIPPHRQGKRPTWRSGSKGTSSVTESFCRLPESGLFPLIPSRRWIWRASRGRRVLTYLVDAFRVDCAWTRRPKVWSVKKD